VHGKALKSAEKPNRKAILSLYRRNDIRNVEIDPPDM